MTAWWYRHYVLGLLFLSYAVNVMDRSSVLAVSLQSIKAEFGASDTQLGLVDRHRLRGLLLHDGHPDRRPGRPLQPPQRAGDLHRRLERHDRAVRHGRELRDAVRNPRRHGHRRSRRHPAVAFAHLGLLPEDEARPRVRDLRARRAVRHGAGQLRRRPGRAGLRLAHHVRAGRPAGPAGGGAGSADDQGAAARPVRPRGRAAADRAPRPGCSRR